MIIIKRLIDFETVQAGLHAYFDNRYTNEPNIEQWEFLSASKCKEAKELAEKADISYKKFTTLINIAYGKIHKHNIAYSDYPTSPELDRLMFVDHCNNEAIIKLQQRLNEEHAIFIKERED